MKALFCAVLLAIFVSSYAANQRYAVKGRLMCEDRPANNVQVKLVDKDIGLDDNLGNVRTNSDGYFEVEGVAGGGITGIDPTLKIYHNCGGGVFHICARRWRLKMPKQYITAENAAKKWFPLGTLNLIVKLEHDEDRNCI